MEWQTKTRAKEFGGVLSGIQVNKRLNSLVAVTVWE